MEKHMNILFVTPDYPKRGQPTTGFPNYLYRVSLALMQMGHKPMILSAGAWDAHRVENGIDVWTVGVHYYEASNSQIMKYVFNALAIGNRINKRINNMIKEMHIDIIQFTSLYGLALLYRGKIPAVLRLSSYAKTAFSSYQTYSQNAVKVMSLFERLSAYKCSTVFAPCMNNAREFGKDCKRNVSVIETPFINDVQEYDNEFVNTYLKGKKYILFFGTLHIEKGILVIAEILEQFLQNNLDYYFVFIGDVRSINGDSASNLLRKYAGKYVDRVVFSKALPHKQLYPVIKEAEFIVLPSLMENLSNACIEAMYFEKIVIGTDGASFEQLISNGRNGLLCRIGDSKDLLEKMQIAVSMSKSEKSEMGKLAKKRIDRLKPKYAVKKLVQLYEYVIEHNKS